MTTVVVQPPAYAQVNARFNPPLVLSVRDNHYHYFTVQLLDTRGKVVGGNILQGQPSASPNMLSDPDSSSFNYVTVFNNLSVARAGTYTLQVNGWNYDNGATHIDQITTRSVQVESNAVPAHQPSSSEARMLAILVEYGHL